MEDEELNEEGIISGPPAKQLNARWLNKFETLELTIEMTKDNVQYMVKIMYNIWSNLKFWS